MFKKHFLPDTPKKDFRLLAIKIYFTIEELKNPYLAHFMIADFIEGVSKDKFQVRMIKIMIQRYLESIISNIHLNNDNKGEISLKRMLE